jgi:hypothetical protein
MVEVKHNERLRGYDTFLLTHQVEQVYYLSYPCEKLSAWWVVHNINPCEWLYTPCIAGYHDNPTLHEEVDEIYQEEELLATFVVDPSTRLDNLVWWYIDYSKAETKTNQEKSLMAWFKSRVQNHDVDEFWN